MANLDRTQSQIVQTLIASAPGMNGAAYLLILLSAMYHLLWPDQVSRRAVHLWRDSRIVMTIVGYARCGVVILIHYYEPETTR